MVPSNLQLKMHISLRLYKIWYSVHWALSVTSEELYKFYMRLWPIIYLWTWTFSYLKCWVVGIQIKWCFEGIASHLSKILLIENGSFSVRHWLDYIWQKGCSTDPLYKTNGIEGFKMALLGKNIDILVRIQRFKLVYPKRRTYRCDVKYTHCLERYFWTMIFVDIYWYFTCLILPSSLKETSESEILDTYLFLIFVYYYHTSNQLTVRWKTLKRKDA